MCIRDSSTVLAERPTVQASTAIGFFWGLGHTLMLLCVGTLLLALNLTIPEALASLFEFAVGVMLVVLGLSPVSYTHLDVYKRQAW